VQRFHIINSLQLTRLACGKLERALPAIMRENEGVVARAAGQLSSRPLGGQKHARGLAASSSAGALEALLMTGVKTNNGDALNREWEIGAAQARFHKDGHWYMPPERFPAALIDPRGYVLFRTEREYSTCEHLRIGDRVNVPDGISAMPGYRRVIESNGLVAPRRGEARNPKRRSITGHAPNTSSPTSAVKPRSPRQRARAQGTTPSPARKRSVATARRVSGKTPSPPRGILTPRELLEFISILQSLFQHIRQLRKRHPLAKLLQFPKIPPFLTESLAVHLINARVILPSLKTPRLGGRAADVIAKSRSGADVLVEVKGTGTSAWIMLQPKDLAADHLVWIDYSDFFEVPDRTMVRVHLIDPKRIRRDRPRITLKTLAQSVGSSMSSMNIQILEFLRDLS